MSKDKFSRKVGNMRDAVLGVVFFFVIGLAMAQTPPVSSGPTKMVRETYIRLGTAILRHRDAIRDNPRYAYRLIEEIVAPRMDFRLISRLVLGGYWVGATSDQRRRFVAAFKRSLMQTGAVLLAQHVDAVAAHFDSSQASRVTIEDAATPGGGNRADVRITVPNRGSNVVLVFKLHKGRTGWKAYDVTVFGVSLLFVYKQQFDSMVRRTGLERVIQRMVAHNESVGLP